MAPGEKGSVGKLFCSTCSSVSAVAGQHGAETAGAAAVWAVLLRKRFAYRDITLLSFARGVRAKVAYARDGALIKQAFSWQHCVWLHCASSSLRQTLSKRRASAAGEGRNGEWET
jgi:hypothetical protein